MFSSFLLSSTSPFPCARLLSWRSPRALIISSWLSCVLLSSACSFLSLHALCSYMSVPRAHAPSTPSRINLLSFAVLLVADQLPSFLHFLSRAASLDSLLLPHPTWPGSLSHWPPGLAPLGAARPLPGHFLSRSDFFFSSSFCFNSARSSIWPSPSPFFPSFLRCTRVPSTSRRTVSMMFFFASVSFVAVPTISSTQHRPSHPWT